MTLSISPEAELLKSQALEKAALVGKVSNPAEQETACEAQKDLTALLGQVEKARKAAKDPVLEFGRRIDDAARTFVEEIKPEQLRIAQLVADFQTLEAAKARAAEQARLAEERRMQEERRQAELAALRAAEQEKQKLAEQERELQRQQSAAKSAREAQLLNEQQAELKRQQALSEAKSHDELDRINREYSNAAATLSEQPKYVPAKASNQRVSEEWVIEVTDIWLLAKAHPSCVKIEPLKSEIKGLLNAGVKVAGVRASKETVSRVSGFRPRAIDV
jgi:hypothetical protein